MWEVFKKKDPVKTVQEAPRKREFSPEALNKLKTVFNETSLREAMLQDLPQLTAGKEEQVHCEFSDVEIRVSTSATYISEYLLKMGDGAEAELHKNISDENKEIRVIQAIVERATAADPELATAFQTEPNGKLLVRAEVNGRKIVYTIFPKRKD